MLLSKITQLVYCSLPQVPIVLQSILLEYFGSFYDVELVEHMNEIDSTMCINWMRLAPSVERYPPEQEKLSLYTHLQESIKVPILLDNRALGFFTSPTGTIGQYDGRNPILVSAKDAKLLFIYHPQVKDALIYHKALDIFMIPYQYSKFYLLPAFFVRLNMFVALPDITQVNGRGVGLRIAVSLT